MPLTREFHLSLSIDRLLSRQRILKRSAVTPGIISIMSELLDGINKSRLIEPVLAFEYLSIIEAGHGIFSLEGGALLRGNVLAKHFAHAEELCAMVCTIGSRLEQKVSDYMSHDDRLRAILLDSIGSEAVDMLAQDACRIIREDSGLRSYEAGSPLSPGMPGFPLKEQVVVCGMVQAERIGVSLTETAMMIPRKSMSMIVGLGVNMPKWTKTEFCEICNLKNVCRHKANV